MAGHPITATSKSLSVALIERSRQWTKAWGASWSFFDDLDRAENTVVIFASDSGFFHGEHGLINKRAMHEESIRIPLLVRYPASFKPGTTVDEMVLNIDLAPTILELARAKPPQHMQMQGRSWLSLVAGQQRTRRQDWLYEYFYETRFKPTPTIQGVRTNRWKYIPTRTLTIPNNYRI